MDELLKLKTLAFKTYNYCHILVYWEQIFCWQVFTIFTIPVAIRSGPPAALILTPVLTILHDLFVIFIFVGC
jgi:hypothetical protein